MWEGAPMRTVRKITTEKTENQMGKVAL